MRNLVLGFKSREKGAEATVLYQGTDGNAAREALNKPGVGFIRAELSYPMTAKYRHFDKDQVAEEVEAKAAAEAEAKAEAEAEAKVEAEEKSKVDPPKKPAK